MHQSIRPQLSKLGNDGQRPLRGPSPTLGNSNTFRPAPTLRLRRAHSQLEALTLLHAHTRMACGRSPPSGALALSRSTTNPRQRATMAAALCLVRRSSQPQSCTVLPLVTSRLSAHSRPLSLQAACPPLRSTTTRLLRFRACCALPRERPPLHTATNPHAPYPHPLVHRPTTASSASSLTALASHRDSAPIASLVLSELSPRPLCTRRCSPCLLTIVVACRCARAHSRVGCTDSVATNYDVRARLSSCGSLCNPLHPTRCDRQQLH
jgi:hypothetical protein